ncbi:MAG TPA: Dam family site-specific DNA-(adenine-N6)-methyltransferase [Myxococcota bacterium]|nr:Dam family site-specific DNA-(adenine-N6)-methyltransferase [Myxococcota bacterium]
MKTNDSLLQCDPFLKWVGSKRESARAIVDLLPAGNCLIEPFVGAGAVFMAANKWPSYLLADLNTDLIDLYEDLCTYREGFIRQCASYFPGNDKELYYERRDRFNSTPPSLERSALFVYLNRLGFNGLCRYNKSGGYNVSFGEYRTVHFPLEEMLGFAAKVARSNVKFCCADFRDTMSAAKPGDVIYCDPPYVPLSATSSFVAYQKYGFTLKEQLDLIKLAKEQAAKGVTVAISNHDTPGIRQMYDGARFVEFEIGRSVNSDTTKRGKVKELLAIFVAATQQEGLSVGDVVKVKGKKKPCKVIKISGSLALVGQADWTCWFDKDKVVKWKPQ